MEKEDRESGFTFIRVLLFSLFIIILYGSMLLYVEYRLEQFKEDVVFELTWKMGKGQ
jgi:hypothetical protein